MSLKRPLSPELNDQHGSITNDVRQLKRFKLHSIIQELQNEEAKLVLLKKLRTSQQLSPRPNKNGTSTTNGRQSPAIRTPTPPAKPLPPPPPPPPVITLPAQPPPMPTVARKPSSSPLLASSTRISSSRALEEQKSQSKQALRKHLERDLLNIPLPKPSLHDIQFIPNGISLEFQPFLGLEDVVQCLSELQADRHRLPQRFTDRAQVDLPNVCDQCGTDFTIRWWQHVSSKSSTDVLNILCDRCKKQVTRRMSKSEHSSLLKNVFISAMKQEKEIDKHFNTLIKQHKQSSRSATSARQIQPVKTAPIHTPVPQYTPPKAKHATPQFIPSKPTGQSAPSRKSYQMPMPPSTHGNHSRPAQHARSSTSAAHHQPSRSSVSTPAQIKSNPMMKLPKNTIKIPAMGSSSSSSASSRAFFPPHPDLVHSFLSANAGKSTSSKRRT